MCASCWIDAGRPQTDTPEIRGAAALVAPVYGFSCVGGNLHIVLDDWNLEDSHLDFCDEQIKKGGHTPIWGSEPDSPEQLEAEGKCLAAFRKLSEQDRYSAMALAEGLWKVPDATRPLQS